MRDRAALGTFADVLRARAAEQPETIAFTWLGNASNADLATETRATSLTYADLDRRARAISAHLQQEGPPGERALLLFTPGLDFIAALFGCFYAGWIAVPAYPPSLNRRLGRIQAVARDARARVALTSAGLVDQVKARVGDLEGLRWRTLDETLANDSNASPAWHLPRLGPEHVAVLQYTSGSTAAPRGVMVTHANLLHNTAQIAQRFGVQDERASESRGVIWLPPYHDMGLVGGILEGVFGGFPISLMASVAFLQRPRRWLEAITRTRATISGGPNFAYDLCVDRIPASERPGLDLSTWQVAFNGSEPVRETTLRRFADAFGPFGFRYAAFYPCYGLAEATLMVSGGISSAAPIVVNREPDRRVVGCGHSIDGQQISIVDSGTHRPCVPGQIGEVWVSGPSVASGYWQQPELTQEVFGARLDAPPETLLFGSETRSVRTGDLGFVVDGELFITGRLKAVLIFGGRKVQAEDIEATLALALSPTVLRPGGVVAMAVDDDRAERLVIVQELNGGHHSVAELEAVAKSIRIRVAEAHQLPVWAIVVARPGSVPRTSSGKVERAACRAAFLNHQLQTLYEWRAPEATRTPVAQPG